MKDLNDLGSVVQSDELAMEVQLSEFQQQRLQAGGNLVIAQAELNKVLGLTRVQARKIEGQLTDRDFLAVSQADGIQQALYSRQDYLQDQLLVREKSQEIRAAYGNIYRSWMPMGPSFKMEVPL